jgi:hypothetical protein
MKSSKFLSQKRCTKANHNPRMEGYVLGTHTHLWGKRELQQGSTNAMLDIFSHLSVCLLRSRSYTGVHPHNAVSSTIMNSSQKLPALDKQKKVDRNLGHYRMSKDSKEFFVECMSSWEYLVQEDARCESIYAAAFFAFFVFFSLAGFAAGVGAGAGVGGTTVSSFLAFLLFFFSGDAGVATGAGTTGSGADFSLLRRLADFGGSGALTGSGSSSDSSSSSTSTSTSCGAGALPISTRR